MQVFKRRRGAAAAAAAARTPSLIPYLLGIGPVYRSPLFITSRERVSAAKKRSPFGKTFGPRFGIYRPRV